MPVYYVPPPVRPVGVSALVGGGPPGGEDELAVLSAPGPLLRIPVQWAPHITLVILDDPPVVEGTAGAPGAFPDELLRGRFRLPLQWFLPLPPARLARRRTIIDVLIGVPPAPVIYADWDVPVADGGSRFTLGTTEGSARVSGPLKDAGSRFTIGLLYGSNDGF